MRNPIVVRRSSRLVAIAALALLGALPAVAQAQEGESGLAKELVNISASVQPGDHVVIAGGPHLLHLMESLAIEVQIAGGLPTMLLNTDRVARSFWTEVPEEYLSQVPEYWETWLSEVDVWIGLPAIENPRETFGDIPQERFALGSESNQFFNDMLNSTPLRGVALSTPTEAAALQNGLDFGTYSDMQWAAIEADYSAIAERGAALADKLRNGSEVRITSARGTDLTFSLADRTVFIDDGIVTPEEAESGLFLERWVTLPGGQVFASVDETSAEGVVVVPRTRCQYQPMTGVQFNVKAGQIEGFRAEQDASCYEDAMAPYEAPASRMGAFSIGLNPELRVMEQGGADYRPADGAGMVWLSFGDNQLLGGQNMTTGGIGFPIVGATVAVDGYVLVENGALVNGD